MKKRIHSIAFGLLTLCIALPTYAGNGEILGKLTVKETHAELANAEVTFENSMTRMTVKANEHGMYYGLHLPEGRYEMRVSYNTTTFVMKNVRIYDGYTSEANFAVSNLDSLPATVEIPRTDQLYSGSAPTGISMKNDDKLQPTRQLGDALSMQPGVDVRDGKVYVKGSGDVKFFIDGTPVIGQPTIQRTW